MTLLEQLILEKTEIEILKSKAKNANSIQYFEYYGKLVFLEHCINQIIGYKTNGLQ